MYQNKDTDALGLKVNLKSKAWGFLDKNKNKNT
jgi:hypothetical protein